MAYPRWSPFDPGESPVLTIDFSDPVLKQNGGAIVSASVVCRIRSGVDKNADEIIPDATTITDGLFVNFQKEPDTGISGCTYLVTAEATLENGAVIYGTAILIIQKGGA